MLVGAFGMTIFANDIMSYINNVIGSFTPGMAVALLVSTSGSARPGRAA